MRKCFRDWPGAFIILLVFPVYLLANLAVGITTVIGLTAKKIALLTDTNSKNYNTLVRSFSPFIKQAKELKTLERAVQKQESVKQRLEKSEKELERGITEAQLVSVSAIPENSYSQILEQINKQMKQQLLSSRSSTAAEIAKVKRKITLLQEKKAPIATTSKNLREKADALLKKYYEKKTEPQMSLKFILAIRDTEAQDIEFCA